MDCVLLLIAFFMLCFQQNGQFPTTTNTHETIKWTAKFVIDDRCRGSKTSASFRLIPYGSSRNPSPTVFYEEGPEAKHGVVSLDTIFNRTLTAKSNRHVRVAHMLLFKIYSTFHHFRLCSHFYRWGAGVYSIAGVPSGVKGCRSGHKS